MKRKIKNIIMIIILVLTLIGMILTIIWKNNTVNNRNTNNNIMMEREMGEPPEKPSGEMGEPPEKPSEENGERPEMPNGEMGEPPEMPNELNNNTQIQSANTPYYFYILLGIESLVISMITIYLIQSHMNKKNLKETFTNKDKLLIYCLLVILTTSALTFASSNISYKNQANNKNQIENNNSSNITYQTSKEITDDEKITEGNFESTTADENALSITGKQNTTIKNVTITKSGDSTGGDKTSFYGINSALIAKDGANVTLDNVTVETDATGANGVFSYGGSATTNNSSSDGTTITISNSKITTKKDNSGGIMTTGGGTMIASNLEIETAGTSSAAIRSDRGGGTVTVDGGTYKTTGKGSPAIYSTADITVKNATLESTTSEGVIIEGKNKITLENTKLIDNNTKLNGQSTTYKNIFIYQSMSGDAKEGTSEFSAKDSEITTKKGDTIYITNTSSKVTLENNKITNEDEEGNFLRIQKDSWGSSGSNGGNVELTMKKQTVEGNVVVDEISILTWALKNKSSYTGTINQDNKAKNITITIDKNSKIKLTGDSYISELIDEDEDYSNIDFNGYKLYVNGKAIN